MKTDMTLTDCDYPVFTAAPDAVGITSTGADGPNQLLDVLKAYRRIGAWVAAGANFSDTPWFQNGGA
jgi:type I restriction enzyme M protein